MSCLVLAPDDATEDKPGDIGDVPDVRNAGRIAPEEDFRRVDRIERDIGRHDRRDRRFPQGEAYERVLDGHRRDTQHAG